MPTALPPLVARGAPDLKSLLGGFAGAALFFVLAALCLSLSRFDTSLAAIWLPSAATVAFLLRMKLGNEVAFYAAAFPASLLAYLVTGHTIELAFVFSLANLVNVAIVTGMTRRHCGTDPDMGDLATLARFVWIGGTVGPLASTAIVALAMVPGMPLALAPAQGGGAAGPAAGGAISWFLTDSMGMVLVVPTVLLIGNALMQRPLLPGAKDMAECAVLMGASMLSVILVFGQNGSPLLFLIVPMTLVHAFRLGSTGTALHVMLVAVVATAMTWAEQGPIAAASPSPTVRLHLIQAFIAANFLTGLPIAATLAGRERLTAELTDGRRELALLANNITDAVLKLDERGICTYASPSVADVLGRAPREFVGASVHALTHEDAGQRIQDVLARLLSGEAERERLTYRRRLDDPEGMPVFIEADCAIALDPATGAREGVVICARDVTERVELELLLTRARHTAERAASAKSDFLANMSHEIRTPMNGVLGFAELMLQGDLDPEQRRHTQMIVESGRSMMLLLNDVLDLSKIEAGQIMIDTGPIDLHATLDECMALHLPAATRKGLDLRLEHEPGGPADQTGREGPCGDQATDCEDDEGARAGSHRLPVVVTDGLRLRQIVLNLIGNAVKFTESGEIRVSYWVEHDALGVRVQDTGIGIDPHRLDTIFQPFTQGESDTARRFGGTGLGLSISRQLADLLGGTITVKSAPGVGSSFTLTLPTTVIAREDAAPALPEPVNLAELPQHARILLVEDHDVNRILVTEMLERCGQRVALAHDGNEALAMIIDSVLRERPFDLVLMDVQMPECDGYTATRAVRGEGIGPDQLPIIALTANAFAEDVEAALAAGMQGHLAKPIVFNDLAKALQRWLPTTIVETPMDHDIALIGDAGDFDDAGPAVRGTGGTTVIPLDRAGAMAGTDAGGPNAAMNARLAARSADGQAHRPSLLERWLDRRLEAIEAVRTALADGLICYDGKRRGADREEREALIGMVHKLAGSAASFGERELGEMAAELEHAMTGNGSCRECERLAFALLALADEPKGGLSQAGT